MADGKNKLYVLCGQKDNSWYQENFPGMNINLSQRYNLNEIPHRIENVLKRILSFILICIEIENT